MLSDSELKQAYELFLRTIRKKAKDKVKASGRGIWTSKMIDNIGGNIVQDAQGDFVIELTGEDYQDFVDLGVNGTEKKYGSPFSFRGKMPPESALAPWIKSKRIQFRDKKGRFLSYKQTNFIMRKSIQKRGFKPLNFFHTTIDEELDKFVDYIAEIQADNLLNGFSDKKK